MTHITTIETQSRATAYVSLMDYIVMGWRMLVPPFELTDGRWVALLHRFDAAQINTGESSEQT